MKRVLSFLMALALVFSLAGVGALAAEEDGAPAGGEETAPAGEEIPAAVAADEESGPADVPSPAAGGRQVTVTVNDAPGIGWSIGEDSEWRFDSWSGPVTVEDNTLRSFQIKDEQYLNYDIEVESEGQLLDVLDVGSIVLAETAQAVTITFDAPALKITGSPEAILAEDPLGDFPADKVNTLRDGSYLPYGGGLMLVDNGYTVELVSDGQPVELESDWVYSDVPGGPIYQLYYVYPGAGFQDYSGEIELNVREAPGARWTTVTVVNEPMADWEILYPDGTLAAQSAPGQGSTQCQVFESFVSAAGDSAMYSGMYIRVTSENESQYLVVPTVYGDWALKEEGEFAYVGTGDESGNLAFRIELTPVLRVEGDKSVLCAGDPLGADALSLLTDGMPIDGGRGTIIVPSQYHLSFSDGVTYSISYYYNQTVEDPDQPIYARYDIEVTDPSLETVTATVSPEENVPHWTQIYLHNRSDLTWTLTDSAGQKFSMMDEEDWAGWVVETVSGMMLKLEGKGTPELTMTVGTAEKRGDQGEYHLRGREDGLLEVTIQKAADPSPAPTATAAPGTPDKDIPKTGDETPLALWMALLTLSSAGLAGLALKKRPSGR